MCQADETQADRSRGVAATLGIRISVFVTGLFLTATSCCPCEAFNTNRTYETVDADSAILRLLSFSLTSAGLIGTSAAISRADMANTSRARFVLKTARGLVIAARTAGDQRHTCAGVEMHPLSVPLQYMKYGPASRRLLLLRCDPPVQPLAPVVVLSYLWR